MLTTIPNASEGCKTKHTLSGSFKTERTLSGSWRGGDGDDDVDGGIVMKVSDLLEVWETWTLKNDCKGEKVGNKANGSGTNGSVNGSTDSLKGQNMFNKSFQVYYVTYVSEAYFVQDDDVVWWVNSGAIVHMCKDRCWFKTYESLNEGSIIHMGNESTSLVHGRGCVDLRFSSGKIVSLFNVLHVPNIKKNLVSSSVLNNYGYKQVIESNKFVLSKHGVFIGFGYLSNHMFRLNIVNNNIGSAFMSTSKLNDSILWHVRLGHVHFKMMQDMYKDELTPAFDMDTEKLIYVICMLLLHWGIKKYFVTFIDDASRFCYVYLLHSNDEALDKFKVFKTEVELQQGSQIKRFRTDRGGEYMDTLYFQYVSIIHEMTAPYTPQQNGISKRKNRVLREMVNSMLSYSGLSQGFWGEAMAVVRLPDPKLKTLGERGIECIFVGYAEHSKAFRFSSVPIPSLSIPKGIEDIGGSVVPEKVTEEVVQQLEPELRKSKKNRTPKDFGPEFQLYLIEGTRDEVSDQHSYCFNVEDDPKTFDEAMKSRDVAFWKEAINDEIDSIMGNNNWVLADLPPGIYYFDTYAPVARISTIRLLIAMSSIHNLVIHRMDVKTTFLNGDLDEEKWHQKFDEVVLSNGYLLNQADKCVYSKFDKSGKGVIICLYVDDMLIFSTDQVQVDLTKEFLSSRFSMKDIWEANVILGIKIKHESNGIAISQSHYIEKVLKKFNYFDCTPVSTLMDTSEKLMPNNGQAVSQLEYSRAISCLMYAMTCTRPDIAFVVGKLSRLTYIGYLQCWKVFLLGGGAISWASKKQTCITGSIMESEIMALATAGKEAEWLKNLLLEIPLWSKPIAPISIRCDSADTLAKAYSQMYNGKSRHLGVKHSMIRELITNEVISIEFVRSQQNLADHLTKRLARDLVIKSAEGMGLKGLKHVYLHIIPMMCLEPAGKEDEVFTSQWLISLKKCLAGA
ncbi:zinc finger, CCHC-type containing protein [Tanacetum coccineum]